MQRGPYHKISRRPAKEASLLFQGFGSLKFSAGDKRNKLKQKKSRELTETKAAKKSKPKNGDGKKKRIKEQKKRKHDKTSQCVH